ncbi:MAG: hypothetical protein Q9220_006215 [cf. Caloplaca sp. 1 TL-2023]
MYVDPATFVPALSAGIGLWAQTGYPAGLRPLPDRSTPTVSSPIVIAKGIDITHILNGTENADFPPRSWLGFGLDMTTVTPSDIVSVASNVLTLSRVIQLQDGGNSQDVGGGVSWIVPKGVVAPTDIEGGTTDQRTFKSGDEAFQAIGTGSDLNARYYAVSGGASAAYAVRKTLQRSYQYLMMAHNNIDVNVHFIDYDTAINEAMLRRRLDRIERFDPTNADVVEQYRSLFATIGSHIITGMNYGGRFQLGLICPQQVWADNSDDTVDKSFEADVSAEFNGLTSGGKVEAGISGSSEFHTFEGSVQKTFSCKGGDAKLGADLNSNIYAKDVFETFSDWANTSGKNPMLHSFQTMTLWDLMSSVNDSEVARRVHDVETAFNWIVENPKVHVTKAKLTITSDWGTIDLLTPSAYFLKDDQRPAPAAETFFSKNKISWTSAGGAKTQEVE